MFQVILGVITMFLLVNKIQYYTQTKDNSIQGLLEYIKDKYYTKH